MPTPPEPDMTVEEVAEAIRSGGAIVCFAKCWACQFDEHPVDPHTWMDEDDMESAKVPVPSSPEGWERLAVEKPCGCWCMKKHRKRPPATTQTRTEEDR